MYYYVSAWKKLGKIAHIFTAAQECLCKVGSASPLPAVNLPPPPIHLDFSKVPISDNFLCGQVS